MTAKKVKNHLISIGICLTVYKNSFVPKRWAMPALMILWYEI